MSLNLRRLSPLLVTACLMTAVLAAPVVARADSLAWSDPKFIGFVGPKDNPLLEGGYTPVAGAFNAVSFSDALHGSAVGVRAVPAGGARSSFLAFTSNGGSTWTSGTIAGVTAELYGVTSLAANNVWAVGSGGTIAHYNGSSWSTKTIDTANGEWLPAKSLYAIVFVDDHYGWAVGDGNGSVKTVNGGATWTVERLPSGTDAYRAIAAINSTSAMAVGDSGKARKLIAGAESSPVTFSGAPTSFTLSGVTFTDPSHGFVVGDDDVCRATSDGGESWVPVALLPPERLAASDLDLRSVAFADAANGIIVGTYQSVWRTTNGGSTWTVERLVDPGTDDGLDLRCVAFAGSADTPVAVGRSARLALGNDDKARAYRGAWLDRTPPPPAAPAAVVASDNGVPRPSIKVSWLDTSSDEDGFIIERAAANGGPLAWSQVFTPAANATSWTDTNVDWTSNWHYRVRAVRGASLSAWAESNGLSLDIAAPVTSWDGAGSYIEAATIHLHADDVGVSGVAAIRYILDGFAGSAAGQNATVHASGVGPHSIEFWSEDIAGNAEEHFVRPFTIVAEVVDNDAPATTSDATKTYDAAADISLTATDNGGTGVAHTYYRLDIVGGEPVEGTSIHVADVGRHTLEFWSIDAKDNEETPHGFASFVVDTAAPVTTKPSALFYFGTARISLPATDGPDGSGVASTYYTIDGGSRVASSAVVKTGVGIHTLAFWSVDQAGNTEAVRSVTFTILSTPSSKGTPTTPSAIPTLTHKKSFTTIGSMKKYSHTYSVKLYFYRYKSGHYVYYKSVTAKSSTALSYLKYSVTTSVPYAAKWRVRARRVVGSTARYSSYEYFTAK